MVTLMKNKAPDRSGYAKHVLPEDAPLILELSDIHELGCTEIADKFEICPKYLRDWLKQKDISQSKVIASKSTGKYSRAQV
jgi:replication fork clamp-binding protein CrfC